jgi:hypothetical protein
MRHSFSLGEDEREESRFRFFARGFGLPVHHRQQGSSVVTGSRQAFGHPSVALHRSVGLYASWVEPPSHNEREGRTRATWR